jgi:hypothetical protein
LIIGIELEAYEVGGFMGPIFQGNVETILNMGGVGFIIVFVAMRRRDTFHAVHADANGII